MAQSLLIVILCISALQFHQIDALKNMKNPDIHPPSSLSERYFFFPGGFIPLPALNTGSNSNTAAAPAAAGATTAATTAICPVALCTPPLAPTTCARAIGYDGTANACGPATLNPICVCGPPPLCVPRCACPATACLAGYTCAVTCSSDQICRCSLGTMCQPTCV